LKIDEKLAERGCAIAKIEELRDIKYKPYAKTE